MPWQEVSIMSQHLEFVTLATASKANIRHLCRCFGISSATAYKWLQRFQAAGVHHPSILVLSRTSFSFH